MDAFTLFIIIVVLVAGALGWHSGFIKQAAQVAGVVLGIIACRIFGPVIVNMLCGETAQANDVLYTVLAYVILFLAVYLAVWMLGRVLKGMLDALHIGVLNRVAGAAFNICKWLILISLVLNAWIAVSPETTLHESPLFDRVLAFAPYLLGTETAVQIAAAVSGALHG